MRCSLVIGVVSDDHPGIVESLSAIISAHGGEWTQSKMVSMGGKFAGFLAVEIPCAGEAAIRKDLEALAGAGVKLLIESAQLPSEALPMREFHLELVGQDRPGIMRDIAQLLGKYGINMEALDTRIECASMSGETLFFADALLHIPGQVDWLTLQDEIEALANELMVEIRLSE